jgi:hypothetical protein
MGIPRLRGGRLCPWGLCGIGILPMIHGLEAHATPSQPFRHAPRESLDAPSLRSGKVGAVVGSRLNHAGGSTPMEAM